MRVWTGGDGSSGAWFAIDAAPGEEYPKEIIVPDDYVLVDAGRTCDGRQMYATKAE